MTDINGIIEQIELLLGSEGTHEVATNMLPLLKQEGYVTFDAQYGFTLLPVPDDDTWTSMVAEAEAATNTNPMEDMVLVIDPITDAKETAENAEVAFPDKHQAWGEHLKVSGNVVRRLYDSPSAKHYADYSYTVSRSDYAAAVLPHVVR